ncbi:hypothetical protein Q7P37_005250 [Cladosporium fusiforme]
MVGAFDKHAKVDEPLLNTREWITADFSLPTLFTYIHPLPMFVNMSITFPLASPPMEPMMLSRRCDDTGEIGFGSSLWRPITRFRLPHRCVRLLRAIMTRMQEGTSLCYPGPESEPSKPPPLSSSSSAACFFPSYNLSTTPSVPFASPPTVIYLPLVPDLIPRRRTRLRSTITPPNVPEGTTLLTPVASNLL